MCRLITSAVDAAIGRLPRRQRAVVTARDVLGWPAAETGRVLGITDGSQRLLHPARSRLRTAPEDDQDRRDRHAAGRDDQPAAETGRDETREGGTRRAPSTGRPRPRPSSASRSSSWGRTTWTARSATSTADASRTTSPAATAATAYVEQVRDLLRPTAAAGPDHPLPESLVAALRARFQDRRPARPQR